MANGDIFQAQVRMNVANQPASFTLGYRETTTTPPANEDSTGALSIAVGQIMPQFQNWLSEKAFIEAIKTRKLTTPAEPPSLNILESLNGSVTGDALPLTKAVLINHKQQTANIRSNGKSYLPGFPESAVDGNTMPNSVGADAIRGIFDNLLSLSVVVTGDTYTYEMVVVKRAPGGGPPAAAYTVTSNSVPLIIYNQRRRQTSAFGAN